jgi:hypothetical protein
MTYTSPSLVEVKGPHYEVTVFWNLEVHEEIIEALFNSFKHKVEVSSIKTGVGKITVEVIRKGNGTPEEVISLVEPLVHLYVLHNKGLNAFNLNPAQGIPSGGLDLQLSHGDALDALNGYTIAERKQLHHELHWLASVFDPLKAFLYGNTFTHNENSDWVQPYLTEEKSCEYYKVSNLGSLRYLPVIEHKMGNIHITSLAITEFYDLPLSKEILAEKGISALRFPYTTLKNNITSQYTNPLPDTHNHLKRLKEKFGENCVSLSHQGFCIDMQLMEEKFEPQYKVLGVRQFYSPTVLERLTNAGYVKS